MHIDKNFRKCKGLNKENMKIALKYVFFNNATSNQWIKLDKKCFMSECCIKNAVHNLQTYSEKTSLWTSLPKALQIPESSTTCITSSSLSLPSAPTAPLIAQHEDWPSSVPDYTQAVSAADSYKNR